MTTKSPPVPALRNRSQNDKQNEFSFGHDADPLQSSSNSNRNSPLNNTIGLDENSVPNQIKSNLNNYDDRPIKPSKSDGYPSPSQFDDNYFPSSKRGKVANSPLNKLSPPIKKQSEQQASSPKGNQNPTNDISSSDLKNEANVDKEQTINFPKRKQKSVARSPIKHDENNMENNTFDIDFDDKNFNPFKTSSKMANSPPSQAIAQNNDSFQNKSPIIKKSIQRSKPNLIKNDNLDDTSEEVPPADYDISNLPPDAFQATKDIEEPEVVPRILSLSLVHREQQSDNEKDNTFSFSMTKEAALAEYSSFIDQSIMSLIDSRVPKNRIKGLNSLQEKLEGIDDLTHLSLPIFRGLEKSPGWNQASSPVNQLIIDIQRHVIIKAEGITKATVSIILPFLVEKLSDRKLKTPITELLNIIAEAICPSFIIHQICEISATNKGTKSMSPKTITSALEIVGDIIKNYGVGNISVADLMPHLLKLLQYKTQDVKAASTIIIKYLYKKFGDPIEKSILDLPGPVVERLKKEFSLAASLPEPTKKFYRIITLTLKPTKVARVPLTKFVTSDIIESATTAKKWLEQKKFIEAVESGLEKAKYSIAGNDLDSIFRIFKTFLSDLNKNLILKSLALLEAIAKASEKGVAKEVPIVAPGIVAAWSDQRATIREQATKTIDAFCVHSTPSPFIKAFTAAPLKANSDTRLEIVKWLQSHINEISQSEMEKLIPFVLQCVEDRTSVTRQSVVQIAVILRDCCSDAFDLALKSLPNSSQREIAKHIESQSGKGAAKSNVSPVKRGSGANDAKLSNSLNLNDKINQPSNNLANTVGGSKDSENADRQKEAQPKEKELPKFASAPTQGKKIKRLKQQQANLGFSMIANKQMIATVADKAKYDAQAILPVTVTQKLFSSLVSDQIEALQELKNIYLSDPQSIVFCSDIIIRWLATRMFDKSVKIITEGICFTMMIFTDDLFSIQEMEVIIPLIFWGADTKVQQVIDSLYDLLFIIRTHSDPTEYSTVLRSCFDLCNDKSLVHLLIELQFTIIDDPRNPQVFTELLGFLDHRSVEVAAACGGVLSLIARRIQPEVLCSIFDSLPNDKKNALSVVVPIEPSNALNFDNFNRLSSVEKIRTCRRLLELLKSKAETVQPNSDLILDSLLHELCCQETDFTAMRLVLFAIHNLLMFCSIKEPDLNRSLQAVTFFGNRWQRKLVLMEGASIAQTVNSILFKLFEKIPPITLFNLLLEGMANYRGAIPPDSFYCKCWVAFANQIEEMIQPGDSFKITQFAKEKAREFGNDDVRSKLCNALIYTLTEKKKETPVQQNNQAQAQQPQQSKKEPLAKSLQRSPGKTIQRDTTVSGSTMKNTPNKQSPTTSTSASNNDKLQQPQRQTQQNNIAARLSSVAANSSISNTNNRVPIESRFTKNTYQQQKTTSTTTLTDSNATTLKAASGNDQKKTSSHLNSPSKKQTVTSTSTTSTTSSITRSSVLTSSSGTSATSTLTKNPDFIPKVSTTSTTSTTNTIQNKGELLQVLNLLKKKLDKTNS